MTDNKKTRFCVHTSDGRLLRLTLGGRCRWAIGKLMDAGEDGHDPVNDPRVRWSSYVHLLRQKGVEIETIWVKPPGSREARYCVYRLISKVTVPGGGL